MEGTLLHPNNNGQLSLRSERMLDNFLFFCTSAANVLQTVLKILIEYAKQILQNLYFSLLFVFYVLRIA